MSDGLSAHDILSDIEFELLQGSISQNELGESIKAVKQHANKLRGEIFDPARPLVDSRELISRQFQINDMLVTLLQEMAMALQAVQLDIQRIRQSMKTAPSRLSESVLSSPRNKTDGTVSVAPAAQSDVDDAAFWWPPAEVENAMRPEAIYPGLAVRGVRVPLVGGILMRARIALHNLALFYTQRLAGRQAEVNRTYGDWILHLDELQQRQQQQLKLISAQLAALQARMMEMQQPSPDSHSAHDVR